MKLLDNKGIRTLVIIFIAIVLNISIFHLVKFDIKGDLTLKYTIESDKEDIYQVFYSRGETWDEQNSIKLEHHPEEVQQVLEYTLPKDVKSIRIDLGNTDGKINLSNISMNYLWNSINISSKFLEQSIEKNDIGSIEKIDNQISIVSTGIDPYIVIGLEDIPINNMYKTNTYMECIFKVIICLGVNILLLLVLKKIKPIINLCEELYANRVLLWNLSKNDFKTKYAGSYLGIFWAFIQPVITILVYWFVFQVGFKSAPVEDFPFILWLVTGLVPWFFFNDSIINATNSMVEYSYLVKKVVFKISILPIVKIMSALFVHLFFMGFTIFLFVIYGYNVSLYTLQIVYYSICTFVLVLGISYLTSAIIVFFKDLNQIIAIVLQIGIWMTPIMWSYKIIPDKFNWIFKINPMYYIVEGYRDSFINHVWFWERYNQTIYFWVLTMTIFAIGTLLFKKLKGHFADVL